MPTISRKSVLLPAPFGPIRQWMSPFSTSRATSDTAARPPKDFDAPSVMRRAGTALLPGLKGKLRRRILAPGHTREASQADDKTLRHEHDREKQQEAGQDQRGLLAVHCDELVRVEEDEGADQGRRQFAPTGEGDPDD